jgi:hypothetical protein
MLLSLLAATVLSAPAVSSPVAVKPCIVMEDEVPVAGRQSRLDSVAIRLGGKEVKVCYGRPSLRGRTMLGGAEVPYGKLWRTGANEPTMIHTDVPLTIAGVAVPAGIFSLYTVPGQNEWEIIVNRSITQWGHESTYTPAVQAQEVGRGRVKSEELAAPVEMFTISLTPPVGARTNLVMEWQRTRIRIPVEAAR